MKTALPSVAPPGVRTTELVHLGSCPRYAERRAAAEMQESSFRPRVPAEVRARSPKKRTAIPPLTIAESAANGPLPKPTAPQFPCASNPRGTATNSIRCCRRSAGEESPNQSEAQKISPVRRGRQDPCQNWESHPHCDARSN